MRTTKNMVTKGIVRKPIFKFLNAHNHINKSMKSTGSNYTNENISRCLKYDKYLSWDIV